MQVLIKHGMSTAVDTSALGVNIVFITYIYFEFDLPMSSN